MQLEAERIGLHTGITLTAVLAQLMQIVSPTGCRCLSRRRRKNMRLIAPKNISSRRYKEACDDFECGWNACINEIMEYVQQIEAEPVRHGRWVHDDLGHTYCSECHERIPYIHCYSAEPDFDWDEGWDEEMPESAYCSHCGAKMDKEEESHATDSHSLA